MAKLPKSSPTHRLGDAVVWLCNLLFGWHNQILTWLTGRSVTTISTAELRKRQTASEAPPVVLVDVRSAAEQSVSKIPGALTAQQYETLCQAEPEHFAGHTVVAYCTVGGRSYLYARKLLANGVDAKNYRDSILGWCAAGLPLQTPDGQPTQAVHPYWRIFSVPDHYEVRL